jgi:acetolactate synthase-1/2/3 large subunit
MVNGSAIGTASRLRVVDHIVEYLAAGGVEYLFGVDGANIEDVYDAAHFRGDVTAVLAKHEFSAAAMADGYSRCGAGLGVVMATSGGGSLNLVPGLGESLASRVPVLALVGQPPRSLDGRGSFQDTSGCNGSLDAVALFSTVSVFCERITEPADIVTALPRAVRAAFSGGPAVLLLPKNIQQAVLEVSRHSAEGSGRSPMSRQIGDPMPIARALRKVEGPVTIVVGEQVLRDDARAELEQLRAVLRARVAVTPDAKDAAGTPGMGSSSSVGVTGVMGHPGSAEAIADSAVCLLVGSRLPVTARAGLDAALAGTRVLSIGSAPPYVPCTHIRSDDLSASLPLLTRGLIGHGRPHGLTVADTVPRKELSPPVFEGDGVRYRDAMKTLDRMLPADVDIVVDAGNTGAAAVHYLDVRRRGRFIVALGMGGMGYSFGAGIGVAFGRHRRTVVIAGDGSFFMHGLELHTAIQHRLPVTFVLFNNNAHGMCVTREQLYYDGAYSYNRFDSSRLGAGLSAMFPGMPAVDVADIARLPDAVTSALDTHGPSVVSIECSADEIPPFAPFLAVNRPAATAMATIHEEEPIDVPASA